MSPSPEDIFGNLAQPILTLLPDHHSFAPLQPSRRINLSASKNQKSLLSFATTAEREGAVIA
jgi:hypothetical protein